MISENKNKQFETPTKIWNSMFISIFIANMVLNLGQQMSNSLLSLYAKSLNAPANQIGQLMSMFAVTALIFRFISGPAMNAFNRKKLLSGAMLIFTIAYLGFSFAPTLNRITGIETITILKGFRLLQGIGNAFGNACCLAIVSDVLPKDKFTTGMGYFAVAQVVAQSIGPTVGVILRDLLGYNRVYIVFACIMIVALLLANNVKLMPREQMPFNLRLNNIVALECLIPAIIIFLVCIGFTSINSFLLVYAEERGIIGGSLFFTIYACTCIATRPLIGRLTEKYGFVKVAAPSLILTAASLVLIGFSSNLPMLLFAAFLNACGYGAVQPMFQSLCLKAVPQEKRGSASSTYYIAMDLGTIVGPIVCGQVAATAGYTPIMWVLMAVPVLIAVLSVIVFNQKITGIEKNFS